MAKTTELEQAYRATTYRVFLPGGPFELRIDAPHAGLARWLAENGYAHFAVLTAWNHESRRDTPARNAERQAALECDLLEGNYEPYSAENVPDAGEGWQEESCFVPDLEALDACALGEDYGQNAVLCGGADGVPRLCWIERDDD